MPRQTSSCLQCGNPKQQGHYLDDYCAECFAAIAAAEQDAAANGKDPREARRAALAARAHNSHRNFVDPRDTAVNRRTVWAYGNRPDLAPTPPDVA